MLCKFVIMNLEFKLSLAFFMILLTCTKELPIDNSSEISTTEIEFNGATNSADFQESGDSVLQKDNFNDRLNHSRMMKTTTSEYDEWWFYTTRKPQIFFKDFPGRPGVATWKEISPGSATDNRKSRQMTTPTASEVSSASWTLSTTSQLLNLLMSSVVTLSLLHLYCI